MSRYLIILLVLLSSCLFPSSDPWEAHEDEVKQWGAVIALMIEGKEWLFRPYTRIHPHDMSKSEICLAHRVPGSGGGHCFIAGDWAVETNQIAVGRITVITGVTVLRAASVTVPLVDGTDLEIEPSQTFQQRHIFAALLPTSITSRNAIAAIDADGNKLGNPHWNLGTSECPWFGPYDGKLDKAKAKPKPTCWTQDMGDGTV